MRRVTMLTTVALALAGVVAIGQGKITTTEDYTKLMKSNAQANGALNKALGSAAYADARTQLTTLRQNFMTLQGFWAERKKDDAVGFLKDGLTRLDALDKMLAAATVDQMAAQAAAKELGGATCGACHKTYREGDAQTGFRFKPGVF
jgi:cytochrome c556